ncbi:hypothetical protein AAFF_G00107060 [Aldrovandia affinis]|uniref:Uncharacterized protein n=1 Tax=Aldrovandia affinis TaxID=143900 RepID=A0AAD7T2B6_9TELE|nr:hypothetical protein AAFF_G00107060 [Aldrovandia affinis]
MRCFHNGDGRRDRVPTGYARRSRSAADIVRPTHRAQRRRMSHVPEAHRCSSVGVETVSRAFCNEEQSYVSSTGAAAVQREGFAFASSLTGTEAG